MKIAINGLGIAGPTLAYWLRRCGHEPVLFERAGAPRTGGYLVDFWGIGYDIAEKMGVLPALSESGYRMKRLQMLDSVGREVASLNLEPLRRMLNGRFISVARTDLAAALLRACADVPIYFGISIVGIARDGDGVTVKLSDGSRDHFDLVIGADGLHSRVRDLTFGSAAHFERPLECYVAAFRVTGYPHRDELVYVSHTAPERHVGRVSLRNDETLILLLCRSRLIQSDPPRKKRCAALRSAFGNMEWEVPQILDAMDTADELYFDCVSQIRLPHWYVPRVGLVGDAAACVSFLAGEGAGLAMLEAYVLAGEVHRAKTDVDRALAMYDQRLRAFVASKQDAAMRFRGFFMPENSLTVALRNLGVRALSIPFFANRFISRSLQDLFELPDYFGASPLQDQFRPSFGSPDPEYCADCGYGQSGRVSPFAPCPSSCFGAMPCSTHCSRARVESKPLRPGPPRQWPMPGSMNSRTQLPCSGPIFSSTDS